MKKRMRPKSGYQKMLHENYHVFHSGLADNCPYCTPNPKKKEAQ